MKQQLYNWRQNPPVEGSAIKDLMAGFSLVYIMVIIVGLFLGYGFAFTPNTANNNPTNSSTK